MLLYWQIAAGVLEWSPGWKIALIVINAVALAALLAAAIGVAVSRRRAFRNAEVRSEEPAALPAEIPEAAALSVNISVVTQGEVSPLAAQGMPFPPEEPAVGTESPEENISAEGADGECPAVEETESGPALPGEALAEETAMPAEEPAEGAEILYAEEDPPMPFADEEAAAEGAEAVLSEEPPAADGYGEDPAGPFAAQSGEETAAASAIPLIIPVGGADYRSGKRRNLSFEDKMAAAEPEMREMYAALKAELLAFEEVKARLSHSWDTFKYKKKKVVAKFSMAGKRLVVHLALNPADYPDAKFPVEDKGGISLYEDTPMAVKVRGASTFKFVKRLIADLAAREGMQRKSVPQPENE